MQLLNDWHPFFSAHHTAILAVVVVGLLYLGFTGAPLIIWTAALAVSIIMLGASPLVLGIFIVVALVLNIPVIRRNLLTRLVMNIMKALKLIPSISQTERTAIEAGAVWVEADLFSGRPDFKKLMNEAYPQIAGEERAFLNGPVEELCAMLDDWEVWEQRQLPPAVWDFIKKHGFFGMIIPKEYGGLGFTAMAHSEVIMKLSSRCMPAAITVMVPNSLGPAELLIHYGTDEQKNHYLPRLARGEDIPCFALTEPGAGSDAGSIQSEGIVFKGEDGKLYMRLNWNKRWITLAAISTVLGLAFKLRDPENLLGRGEDLGITCALIPTKTPGVVVGRRHDPLGVPFYNCPTQGKGVVVSIDTIVGGAPMAGQGWRMLTECLAAGRGISLPAQSTGGVKLGTRVISAHATIRRQFGLPIGKFEGIEEPMARIAGFNYLMEALRRYTLGAIDKGIKPSVITAIAKYQTTELSRKVVNDAMDILGGAGISKGPRNMVAHYYTSVPIGITVEGANILTRTLIIFGQGALRAHPYAFKEVNALEKNDLNGFDKAFWGHMGHIIRNLTRCIVLSFTRGRIILSPFGGSVGRYFRRLAWVSASFAILSDIAMAAYGGKLKTREKITGRFADILSWMYIGTAVLRRFKAEGSRKEDLPFVHFTMNYAFYQIQDAFDGILTNFEMPGLSWFFRGPVRWISNMNTIGQKDTDTHVHKIASRIMIDGEMRDRLTEGIYLPTNSQEALGRLEEAFRVTKRAEVIEKKIKDAVRSKVLPKAKFPKLIPLAVEKGVITEAEKNDLANAEALRYQAIQVDDFSEEEYLGHKSHGTAHTPLRMV